MPDGSTRILGYGEITGKGNKRRSFLISEQAVNSVVEYLKQRGPDDNPALFTSSRHKRLSRRNIQDILYRWCHRLQLNRAHIHQLRHTFATRMANAGMSSTIGVDKNVTTAITPGTVLV
jgi:site-specific recombinase XerC